MNLWTRHSPTTEGWFILMDEETDIMYLSPSLNFWFWSTTLKRSGKHLDYLEAIKPWLKLYGVEKEL